MEKICNPFKVGTKLLVKSAGKGAYGCNGLTATVIEGVMSGRRNGICEYDLGFFVLTTRGDVWKVRSPGIHGGGEYEVIDSYKVELI